MMYKLVACVLILFALMQKAVQDGNCPDCGVPTAEAFITSTFSSSVDRTRQRRQAAINLEPDSNVPKTRGSKFALAFMGNRVKPAKIMLYITTEQSVSNFTIKTKFSGLIGFNKTSSGLYSHPGTARRGEFTVVELQVFAGEVNEQPGISVLTDGNIDQSDRQKGLILTTENPSDELTIYALSTNNNMASSSDAFMAINCVEFPTARDYQYFVFSSDVTGGGDFQSQLLITPCQDETTIRVRPSQVQHHPSWVNPSVNTTYSQFQGEVFYELRFNRFDTLLLSNLGDLTGTIITSDKPLSVFSGALIESSYLVEQVPPHQTYGDFFFLPSMSLMFRIGSVSNETSVEVNCLCEPVSASSNRVLLSGSGSSFTATINQGQYVECRSQAQGFCSVQSSRPVTVMNYNKLFKYFSMVYIPPVDSYLTRYSLTSLSDSRFAFLSYTLQERDYYEPNTEGLIGNGDVLPPSDGFTTINCNEGFGSMSCGRGATGFLSPKNYDIKFSGDVPFWGFVHGVATNYSYAHPLPFKMVPIGLVWIEAQDMVVMETVGLVNMGFRVTNGDTSLRTRAFVVTKNITAIEGEDYGSTGLLPSTSGNCSKLEWRAGNSTLNNCFLVPIIDDDIPEPVEVFEIFVECEANGNCYLPRQRYTITIIDDQGQCDHLPPFPNGNISYSFDGFPLRPYGTVATYTCNRRYYLSGDETRTCTNSEWLGTMPTCIDSSSPKTRGNKFALAFMRNDAVGRSKISLYITTEQDVSAFTIKTRLPDLIGFNEVSPDSGLFFRTGTARRGHFTVIQLQAGGVSNGQPDLSVQSDGDNDTSDRQKGLIITADNPSDELTVYALSSNNNVASSADAFMAINCVEFPTANNYQYFVFSSGGGPFESQFLITPCQDDTRIGVRPSQTQFHPSWVSPNSTITRSQKELTYGLHFNRFDTLMLSNVDDLTGTIVTSNKPLSVFSGHQCGTPINNGTCSYLVEQIPPHPTYGDMFLLAPFNVRQTGAVYRIGTVSNDVSLQINCPCDLVSDVMSNSNNSDSRMTLLSGSGRLLYATISQGQYAECRTPPNNSTFCSVKSTRPVTVMIYTLGSLVNNLDFTSPISDPSMVYIPPVDSYLTRYSLTSLSYPFSVSLSYTLRESNFANLNSSKLLINKEFKPSDDFTTIDCIGKVQCGRGATRYLGQRNFNIQFFGDVPFWGYAYGSAEDVSFAYPLPFEMIPIGLARIETQNKTVMENVGLVDMGFMITGGYNSVRTRAFAVTSDLSATEGADYNSTGLRPGKGKSNLRWGRHKSAPIAQFIVPIIDDDIPEPIEVLEIFVECEKNRNCYLPRQRYTITIIDDQGQCHHLLPLSNGNISYSFDGYPLRPYGTVATYTCNQGYYLSGDKNRTCNNSEWLGTMPTCIDSNSLKTRGNKFALAFMRNAVGRSEISLHITTEQDVSAFTIETRLPDLVGFNEVSPDSGLFSRTGTAQRGHFTVIQLQAGGGINRREDLSVQSDGNNGRSTSDRQKGLILTADNLNDELTVYALSSNNDMASSADAFMAINCVEFPTAKDYQYFIFSSDATGGESQFLITPCQDDTTIQMITSQKQLHPSWVRPNPAITNTRVESTYGVHFNRFNTLMLSNVNDLTGTIVTSDKPLSVFSGHQCGNPTKDRTCDYLVEQIPPHPTYGDMFLLAPFDLRQSGEVYRIGTVSDEASIQVNCLCEPVSASRNGRRVLLSGFGRSMTAVINRGQYVECRTPHNSRTFCSVQSTRPITVMSYTLGSSVDNLNFTNLIISPSMVYIPPVDSYLTRYSLTSLSDPSSVSLSYTLRGSDYEPNTQGLLVNGDAFTPTDGFTTIDCSVDCIASMVCGRGATGVFGVDAFDITFFGDVPFWGYAYGFAKDNSFAYPLPFAMKPIGLAWIEAQDMTVLETVGQVDMEFLITRGDRSTVTRAFAVTRNLSATEGEDYTVTGVHPGTLGNSNMRWRRRNSAPNNRFIVPIIDDDIPEPIEKLEIFVECDASENCYLPRQSYTITIIDDQGQCDHLPSLPNGNISYSFGGFPLRPYGTVATYTCNQGYYLSGNETRACNNSEWFGKIPTCKAFCRDLLPIDNGVLDYDMMESLLNATRPNGTVATYTCDDGFRLDGNTRIRICDTGNWTATAPVCIENPTAMAQSISQGGGLSDLVIISIIVVVVVAALAILAIVCCLYIRRSIQNKGEGLKVYTVRQLRKLSGPNTLMEYQTRQIVKYVPESMRIPSSNLKLQDAAVGQGAFGIVYKGLLMDWNNVAMRGVALKTLKGLFTQSDVQSMVREITKMQEFHHHHVMPLIGVCLDAGPGVSMVMPYMTNGSLLDYLKKERSNLELAEGEDFEKVFAVRKLLLKMCHQIALGMGYLAEHKFVHRDLAARNCMLDSNGDIKVGDFGLAEDVCAQGYFRQGEAEGVKLPYKWSAVESLSDAIFNEKTDVWSYGVTVWEVFSGGRTPYPGVDPMSLVALLKEGKRLEPPQNTACSADLVSLMTSCWYEDPEERPSFDELAAKLEKVLSIMVGYVELNMELVAITEDEHKYDDVLSLEEHAEAVTEEEVAMETDSQQFESESCNGYRETRTVDTTGYANVLYRRPSYQTSV